MIAQAPELLALSDERQGVENRYRERVAEANRAKAMAYRELESSGREQLGMFWAGLFAEPENRTHAWRDPL